MPDFQLRLPISDIRLPTPPSPLAPVGRGGALTADLMVSRRIRNYRRCVATAICNRKFHAGEFRAPEVRQQQRKRKSHALNFSQVRHPALGTATTEFWASRNSGNLTPVIPYSARSNQIGCPHWLPLARRGEGAGGSGGYKSLARIPQPRRNPVNRNMNPPLHPLIRLPSTISAHQLHLQVVQRIDIRKAVADGAL